VRSLRAKGVNADQIIAWGQVLSRFQTAEQFNQYLAQYTDTIELLNSRKQEAENWESRLLKAQSQVEALEKERAKIEGAIEALKVAGVEEIKEMTEKTIKQLKIMADSEKKKIQSVAKEFRGEFNHFFTQIDALVKKAIKIGEELERTKQELQKYERIKEVLESLEAVSEVENEGPGRS